MFDWFWDFLYLITKSIFQLIDALLSCCNMLCGIDPVTIDGQQEDLMTWLLNNESIKTGFKVTAMIGLYLVVFFAIWAIIKTIVSEKPEGTPAQVVAKAGRSLLTFLFIPLIMYVLVKSLNTIAEVMYNGTKGGSVGSLGQFLALSFGQGAQRMEGINIFSSEYNIDYTDTDVMWEYFELSDYDYFFSWVAGIAILFTMTKVLMIFIDRMFSIVILYIISPIPIAANLVDGGQRFKQWRDQLLSKFLVGYGAILGLNVYGIVVSALVTGDVVFFSDSYLNFVFKIIILLGGTFALNRIIAMIGNIVATPGAGDQEVRASEAMRHGVVGAARFAAGVVKGDRHAMEQGVMAMHQSSMGQSMGAPLFGGGGYGGGGDGGAAPQGDGGSNKSPTAGKSGSNASGAAASANPYVKAGEVTANAISGDHHDANKTEKSAKDSAVGNAILNNNNQPSADKQSNKARK